MENKRSFPVRSLGRLATMLAATGLLVIGASSTAMAADADCNGVFPGQTPTEITKSTETTSALPGDTVSYTITWTPNGADEVNFVDCFRVDDGADSALNALVEVGNLDYTGPNDGSEVIQVAIPDDEALIGHSVVDRVKCTKGCQESRSGIVSVTVTAPVAPTEICDDEIDNDEDGTVDEDCEEEEEVVEEEEEETVVDDNTASNDDDDTQVLGVRLAKTGGIEVIGAAAGLIFLGAGGHLIRFGRSASRRSKPNQQ